MIGFSIMMWFISIILCLTAVSLLRGNTAAIHGKVFEATEDKTGYGKAIGKTVLFMSMGILVCGIVALFGSVAVAIRNALIVLGIVVVVAVVWFLAVQKHYRI